MKKYTVTNIRIAKEDLKKLKLVALERDESVSALLRELIADALLVPKKRAKKKDGIWNLAKLAVDLQPRTENLTKRYRGLGKESWKKLGGGEAYLKQERKSWEPARSKKR